MSAKTQRRRLLAVSSGRSPKTKPKPTTTTPSSSSPSASRRASPKSRSSKPIKILKQSRSEPNLLRGGGGDDDDDDDDDDDNGDGDRAVYLPEVRAEVFASSPLFLPGLPPSPCPSPSPSSPSRFDPEGYRKEAKVVITVSVEGSPGPIRTMVKLGCSVDETINLVVDKYLDEGRTPKLDKDAAFELHQSHFSLQSLDKKEKIGDIGSRSFYLRKSSGNSVDEVSASFSSEIVPVRSNIIPCCMIQSFIAQNIGKIVRRTRKIWNILVCMQ